MGQGIADKNAPLVRSLVFSPSSVLILVSRLAVPNSENQYKSIIKGLREDVPLVMFWESS